MFKLMAKWLASLFAKQIEITGESVNFTKQVSTTQDVASLTITISGSKELVSMMESALRLKTYQLMAEEAAKTVEPLEDNLVPFSNMEHQRKVVARQFN